MLATKDELLAAFEAEGVSVREWAISRGYKPATVYRVISGKSKCTRGVTHRIAVELGLKNEPENMRFRPMVDAA